MTSPLNCEALRQDIVALLYDDGEPAEKSLARDHLAQCVACRSEYASLKAVRRDLAVWSLPPLAAPAPARLRHRWFPAGLAAAAGLVLGIGVAMAGRTAFISSPSAPNVAEGTRSSAPAALVDPEFVSHEELQKVLQTQEERHLAEIADLRRSLTLVSGSLAPQENAAKSLSSPSAAAAEKLLKASEERQTRMVEARLAGLRTQIDLQRQYDLAQIAAGLAYIDSRTGADAARTSELMKNLVRVTAKPQDR